MLFASIGRMPSACPAPIEAKVNAAAKSVLRIDMGESALRDPQPAGPDRRLFQHRRCRLAAYAHKDVEVHSVDPFNREPHMTADDLSDILCYIYPAPVVQVLPLEGV
jgi:hypothetical protein